ncbi:hypothetical protein AVEN_235463-1 [Araneus ventricosus]|uniref:Uncharacterized protein n=1 Tax=Araneus ventricosus TaxID=182803 RepID=A0A4Y2A428_ARAVE|nr:hypothetical protein AVEN_235463-1 [Araneus ventricosus]
MLQHIGKKQASTAVEKKVLPTLKLRKKNLKIDKLLTRSRDLHHATLFLGTPVMKNSLEQYVLKSTWQGFNRSYEDMDRTPNSNS